MVLGDAGLPCLDLGSGMANYKVLIGVDYAGKRAEAGDVISDVPSRSVSWLLDQGIIEKIDGKQDVPKPSIKREPESPKLGEDE